MSTRAIDAIERELSQFDPAEQERLAGDIATYLRRLHALRQELRKGEREIERGDARSVTDLEAAIEQIRFTGIR